jgi:hypothetical protein
MSVQKKGLGNALDRSDFEPSARRACRMHGNHNPCITYPPAHHRRPYSIDGAVWGRRDVHRTEGVDGD